MPTPKCALVHVVGAWDSKHDEVCTLDASHEGEHSGYLVVGETCDNCMGERDYPAYADGVSLCHDEFHAASKQLWPPPKA